MENKRKWLIGYAVLCILYFVVSAMIPHDRLDPRGLEGVGKPSLRLKTEEITDDTELRFEYYADEDALSQLSFYFTDNGHLFSGGEIQIEARDLESGALLGSQTYSLADLEVEAFWGVVFEEEPKGRSLEVVITGRGIAGNGSPGSPEGPSVWLNTVPVHDVRKPFLMTCMFLLLGGMFFLLWGKKSGKENRDVTEKKTRRTAAFFGRIQAFCGKYRRLLGLGLLLFLVALIFFYVYDGEIRKAMNSTHRVVVMRDNSELLPVTAKTQDLVQYYTTEEEELVGLGVRMDLSVDFVPAGSIQALRSRD